MNKTRRSELTKIGRRLVIVKNEVLDITSDLGYICDEENDSLNNMANFSGTDRYAAIEEAADNINDALDSLDEVIENIDSAINSINEASR